MQAGGVPELRVELALVQADELAPQRLRGVQRLERRQRLALEPDVEDGFVNLDRLALFGERFGEQLGAPEQERLTLLVVFGDLGAPLQDFEQAARVAGLFVE